MPLDTGAVTHNLNLSLGAGRADGSATDIAALDGTTTLGSALRAVRIARGFSLADMSVATRVRSQYLAAIEDMRLDLLPSRPFAIGYARAYASALDLDPNVAAARFRQEAPDGDEGLHEPVGVRRERDPRLGLIAIAAAVVGSGVLAWNIVQHTLSAAAPPRPGVASVAAQTVRTPARAAPGPVTLGAPLPAPVESTVPPPYVTPGLEAATHPGATGAAGTLSAAKAAAANAALAAPADPVGTPFAANGVIFGAPAQAGALILQAKKPASMVIHGADGSVYFARQLAAGQAYRVLPLSGLTVDTPEPESFDVYVGGLRKGVLPAAKTPLSKLAG
jgi:cytoskeleton protein RodZ